LALDQGVDILLTGLDDRNDQLALCVELARSVVT
jgi:hypothetical protein